ncbi:hypothetical protein GQ44DRAFT_649246, partial [Phaeosphaeriaceae sp. PMI808]
MLLYFHGGGFCTGTGSHIPWLPQANLEYARKHKAIVWAIDYPLLGNLKDIDDACSDLLRFIKEDGCFEEDEKRWTNWLKGKIEIAGVALDMDRILADGDSAGGHALIITLFRNFENETAANINIRVALLRYPMITHYERTMPEGIETLTYMGKRFSKHSVLQQAEAIVREIQFLENMGLYPTETKGYAPQRMSGAFLLSSTGLWKAVFQRVHGCVLGQNNDPTDVSSMDCIERAKMCRGKVDLKTDMYILHAHDDTHCRYEDTERFKDIMMEDYQYKDGETIHLEKVTEISVNKMTEGKTTVGHAFDNY